MMRSTGSVYLITTKACIASTPSPLTLMVTYPCEYGADGSPIDATDYIALVHSEDSRIRTYTVMELLDEYGPTSCRWCTDFWKVV